MQPISNHPWLKLPSNRVFSRGILSDKLNQKKYTSTSKTVTQNRAPYLKNWQSKLSSRHHEILRSHYFCCKYYNIVIPTKKNVHHIHFCLDDFNNPQVLATIAVPIFSLSEDRFKELFEAKTPIKQIMAEVMSGNAITIYKHFQVVQDHIKKKDKYASYAKTLKSAAQKMLDSMLREVNCKEKVDLEEYVNAAYNVASGLPQKDVRMLIVIEKMNEFRRKLALDVLEEAEKTVAQKILKGIDDVADQGDVQTESLAKKQATKEKKNRGVDSNPKPRRTKTKTLQDKNSNVWWTIFVQ